MTLLLILALALYSVPLLATAIAVFVAAGGPGHGFVDGIAALCQFYQKNLAFAVLGNILTPLVTALAIKPRDLQTGVPALTKGTIAVFVLLLAIAGAAYAELASQDTAIREYGKDVAQPFYDAIDAWARQLATFLALAFGITLKPEQ